jgi:hypothetical protein
MSPEQTSQQPERVSIGLARVVRVERFVAGVEADRVVYADMDRGEVLPLLAPNDWERARMRDFVKRDCFRPTPHVVVEWRGARRFVPVASLRGEDESGVSVLRRGGED